jgi:hypothetical protein
MKTLSILVTAVALVVGVDSSAADSGMSIEATLCRSIENREPVDVTDTFRIADGQVITFSRVTGGADTEIHHVYFMGDTQFDDITLPIGGSPWRTHSRKTLRPDKGMAGDWRVEIRDAGGAVLQTLKFKVE